MFVCGGAQPSQSTDLTGLQLALLQSYSMHAHACVATEARLPQVSSVDQMHSTDIQV